MRVVVRSKVVVSVHGGIVSVVLRHLTAGVTARTRTAAAVSAARVSAAAVTAGTTSMSTLVATALSTALRAACASARHVVDKDFLANDSFAHDHRRACR